MSKPLITFVLAVAGEEKHFHNLERCLWSIKNKITSIPYCVLVINGKHCRYNQNNVIRTIPYEGDLSRIERHLFWRMRYDLYKYVDTEYTMYLDSDTVICNDTVLSKINEIGEKFGICQHFWVPTLSDYKIKAGNPQANLEIDILSDKTDSPFIASGAFIFKNNKHNLNIIKNVTKIYSEIYPKGASYKEAMTDEVWLTLALKGEWKNVHFLGGAFNHCCEQQIMPIRLNNEIIEGKNPFEHESFAPITLLHCDLYRRDPRLGFDKNLSDKIAACFGII